MIAYGAWTIGSPVYHEFQSSFAMKEFKQYGLVGTYRHHFFSFLDRFAALSDLERENEELTQKLAQLEKQNTLLESSHTERELASLDHTIEADVKKQTGSQTAVVLESITYEVPEHVSNTDLYALALGYFRKQEYEKVVVLFHYLFTLKDDQQFMKSDNYLMNGIAWYHLKNYHEAHEQINLGIKNSTLDNPIHRTTVLWDALISQAEGNRSVTQAKLLKFLELYPHSEESRLINTQRSPAGETAHHE